MPHQRSVLQEQSGSNPDVAARIARIAAVTNGRWTESRQGRSNHRRMTRLLAETASVVHSLKFPAKSYI